MRLKIDLLPVALLILFPLYVYLYNLGLIKLLAGYVVIFILREVIILTPIFNPSKDHKLILEGIHISPYVEKVRWCLDYIDQDYVEEQDVGILGLLLLGRRVPVLKVPTKNIKITNSSDILRYVYAIAKNKSKEVAQFLEPTPQVISYISYICTNVVENLVIYCTECKNMKKANIILGSKSTIF